MKQYNGEKAIISFTSFGKRLDLCSKMLFKLYKDNILKEYHTVLTIHKKDVKFITEGVQYFIDKNLIELIVCDEDIGPHTKYWYAMKKYYDKPIITLDDDRIYQKGPIDELYKSYKRLNKHYIYAVCAIDIQKENKKIKPLRFWQKKRQKENTISFTSMAEGFAGILYPPKCFKDLDKMKANIGDTKYDDDLYLKLVEIEENIPVYKTNFYYHSVMSSDIDEMMKYNLHENQNVDNINRDRLIMKYENLLLKSFIL